MSAIEIQKAEYCSATQSKTNYIYSSKYFNSQYSVGRIERKYDDKNAKRFVGYRLIIGSDDLCFDDVFFVIGWCGIKRACLKHTKQMAEEIVNAYTTIVTAKERLKTEEDPALISAYNDVIEYFTDHYGFTSK